VLIGTILSQNTNDLNRDRAFASLRGRFATWEEVLEGRRREIARAIRVGGLAEQKSGRIKEILRWLKETRGELSLDFICRMRKGEAIETLRSLPGVGPKTAAVVLLFACGKEVFPVDTHIHRVTRRLGLVPESASAEKAHEVMGELVPRGAAYRLHLNMIRLGRAICHPRRPRCDECPLEEVCLKIGVVRGK